METSMFFPGCQRTRKWCEPGHQEKQKILPELQSERRILPVSAPVLTIVNKLQVYLLMHLTKSPQ